MSARENIMAAVGSALTVIPGAVFFRSREAAFGRNEGTAILLEPEEERVEKRTQSPQLVIRRLTIVVTVITRGDVPDQIADSFLQQINTALINDPTLGGLCAQVVEQSTRWSFAEADLTAGRAELRLDILYQTLASTLANMQ